MNDDVISRQSAIDTHCELCGDRGKCGDICPDVEAFRLIPAQPQRTGRWEIYVISMLDGEGCKCSECGFEGVPYWDFCPNCGARMEENNESD